MTFKETVYQQCCQLVAKRITFLQQNLADLKESGKNETKSTAGDKHETALAMLQIEQENNRRQLTDALNQQVQLQLIDINLQSNHIIKGSLIDTNNGFLFIGIALGKLKIDDQTVISLSPQSPLGQRLMGLKAGDMTVMNGVNYVVNTIQ